MAGRARQLVLDLATRPALGRADFFVSPSNRLALAQLDTWPGWPEGRLAVTGPAGSGKTHLAHVWAAGSGARILPAVDLPALDIAALPGETALAVEDADRLATLEDDRRRAAEEALFHVANRLAAAGGSLMVSGRSAPAQWDLTLPDLASRLGAAPVARLEPPDDALLAAVLVKLFTDRQLPVAPEVVTYLVSRMDRSFAAAERLVARLDAAGLERRRRITRSLAAEVLHGRT
ncbi:HdaA/DnaA family protein [Amaricoccus sp. W119]|uniref:HdaA/DnaA family protein n=1 Tax=Amaricoccus sp. W119 TaxID=3391833 RepID=UPI0039A65E3D